MRATNWGSWAHPDEAARRAGGRRHYNFQRQLRAAFRQAELIRYMTGAAIAPFDRQGAELARRFGVSRSTICRDLEAIFGFRRSF